MKSITTILSPVARITHNGYLFAFLFAALIAGCSGGQDPSPAPSNTAPVVAKAGPIIGARVGETPVLDGSKSFTSFTTALSYRWSFTHKPHASKAILNGENSANPSFTADARGVYTVQLVVSANGLTSQRAIQVVIVTTDNERLTGTFNHVGLSSECVSCHNGELVDPGKSPDHIGTSNMCQACHTPQGAAILPFIDHVEVFGNCSGCHNGVTAIGKSSAHTPTSVECDSCHNTTSFLLLDADGKFDHSSISRECNGCHNGTVAIGMTATTLEGGTHPDTSTECGSCHTTDSFLNAYPDHTGPAVVGNRCDSCHGVSTNDQPSDPPIGHPVANVDCDTCHSITSFNLGGLFNHRLVDASIQPCESCHNDNNSINARGKGSAVPAHPITGADCGSCHYTDSFTPAFGVDHSGISSGCSDSCHIADGSGTASGKPISTLFYAHMPTTPDNQDCADCHTPGTFTTGTYDHAGVVSGCNSCHDNRVSIAKLANHIPTNPDSQDCADCHNTTNFADATFDHSGIDPNNCTLCHDGRISTGKSTGHVDTDLLQANLDCSTCHATSTFTTFTDTFVHDLSVVGNNCAACHDAGIATPKKIDHIPALDECSACHDDTSTGGFASTTFLSTVHPGINTGCEGCHVSKFITNPNVLKAASHIPTSQDCDVCHNNTVFTPSLFDHSDITGNCSSCHDGNANNVAAGALAKTPTHLVTTQDCGVCHNTVDFAGAVFDHTGRVDNCTECHGDGATGAVTKKHAGHVTTAEDCSVCHQTGSFANATFDHTGIVNNCASCHDGAGAVATVKHAGHLATSQDCSLCHNTSAFAGARFDHTNIVDNCASCHDGATARGKSPPPNHVPTNDDCSVCHQTTGFVPGAFGHVGIVDNCSSCHDGAFATGKTTTHLPTSQDCSVCHTTSSFIGAGFDHSGIVNNCESCHDGGTAIGKDAKVNPPHIATALDCHLCHTTATFLGGTWTHDANSAGSCNSCHNATVGATDKPGTHLSTTVQCDVCHSTSGWAPSIFSHDPQGNYPGDHRVDPGCSECHGNTVSDALLWPSPQYAPFCAGCHAGDFDRKGDHNGGENGTIEQNKDCAESGCHKVSDRNFD